MARDQAGVGEMAYPDREIDTVFDQIDHAVRQSQFARDLGITCQIGRHHRADMEAAESDRRRDHQPAARPRPLRLCRAFGFLDIGENPPDPFPVARADVGQRHLPRGPLQQPRAQTFLQRRNQPRHARGRQPEFARGRRKPLKVGHRDKGLHGVDAIHGIVSYLAMMKCQSGRLFKFRKGPHYGTRARASSPAFRNLPMSDTHTYSSDVAFTPAVKAIQTRKGSRDAYADVEERGGWRTEIDEDLAEFLAEANSLFFATASADGQPYIQHRGGPKGFVKVLDNNTLAFTDYGGNRQYITQGNLSENPKAHIFLMDYAHRRRVKIWGEARVIDDDPALVKSLMPQGYKARPEQVILFKISAWDTNCPQHIPQKFDAADVAAALASRDGRIAELEAELAARKGQPAPAG